MQKQAFEGSEVGDACLGKSLKTKQGNGKGLSRGGRGEKAIMLKEAGRGKPEGRRVVP